MALIYFLLVSSMWGMAYLSISKSRLNLRSGAFASVAFFTGLWALFNFLIWNSSTFLLWNRLAYFSGSIIVLSVLIYVLAESPWVKQIKTPYLWILSIPTILFCTLSPTTFIVASMPSIQSTQFNIGNSLFGLYVIIYLLAALIIGIVSLKHQSEDHRKRMMVFLISFFSTLILSISANLLFPTLGYTEMYKIGPLFTILFIGPVSYGLIKFQIFNLRLIVSKLTAWFLTAIALTTLYLMGSWLFQLYISPEINDFYKALTIVYFLTAIHYFPSLRLRLQTTANRLFLKNQIDNDSVIQKIQDQHNQCIDLPSIAQLVSDTLVQDCYLEKGMIFIPNITNSKEFTDPLSSTQLPNELIIALQQSPSIINLMEQSDPIIQWAQSESLSLLIPCLSESQTIQAIIAVGPKSSQDRFDTKDIQFFSILGGLVHQAIERLEKVHLSAEMDLAQRIQHQIIPKNPHIDGLELACHMKPVSEVGGDYFDVINAEKYTWMIIGDVTGHGVASGLVMFMVQSIISSLIQQYPQITPGELNFLANSILVKNLDRLDEQRPMTIATFRWNHECEFDICGSHDHLYIFRHATQSIDTIELNHFPLGIGLTDHFEGPSFPQESFKLNPHDFIFIGTDGIEESYQNGDLNQPQFGQQRLLSILNQTASQDVNDIKNKLLNNLQNFTTGVYHDDLTFILAKATSSS